MIILQDTREKQPWNFISYEECERQEVTYLGEGDYTLAHYSNLVCIERKKSVSELAGNLGRKYTQFKKEMERFQKYRFRYVICEFTQEQMIIYPTGTRIPASLLKKVRITGKFLHKRVEDIVNTYQVEFIFCNDKYEAKDKAISLLQQAKIVYEEERNRSA